MMNIIPMLGHLYNIDNIVGIQLWPEIPINFRLKFLASKNYLASD